MMRQGPHQVPQVAGESLAYHAFSHAHMATVSSITGISPDVVLSRLWVLPIVLVTIAMIATLARLVTGRSWAGPLAIWITIGAAVGNTVWTDRPGLIGSPIVFGSPSQVYANPLMLGATLALVTIAVRSSGDLRRVVWLSIVSIAAVGAKPTVIPVLAAGIAFAFVVTWALERRPPWRLALAFLPLAVIQGVFMALSPPIEGKITILGSIGSLGVFREMTGVTGMRAVSETLLLDSIDSTRAWFAASVAIVWLAALQALRLVGLGVLAHPRTRRNPVSWLLAGVFAAGWGAFFLVDQAGFSQVYFVFTVVPIGAILSAWFLVVLLEAGEPQHRRLAVIIGVVAGVSTTIIVRGLMAGRQAASGYGAVESALGPALLVVAIRGTLRSIVETLGRRSSHRPTRGSGAGRRVACAASSRRLRRIRTTDRNPDERRRPGRPSSSIVCTAWGTRGFALAGRHRRSR